MKGKKVFIRTVTMYFSGKVARVTRSWIVLTEAAWVPDMGRFADALNSGRFAEVEPVPTSMLVRVARSGVIDVIELGNRFALPREQR